MAEVNEKEKVTEAKEEEVTKEETAAQWEMYVRNELNTLLDIYLPASIHGNVGIKYVNPVKAKYETHTDYDKTKAVGVQMSIVFAFEKPIDVPKEE